MCLAVLVSPQYADHDTLAAAPAVRGTQDPLGYDSGAPFDIR